MGQSHVRGGIIGGLVAGIVLGVIMMVMGEMLMFGALVGSNSMVVSWIVHLAISAVVGLTFAWWFGLLADDVATSTTYGILHGVIWWAIAPLVLMPIIMGDGVQLPQAFSNTNLLFLLGYAIQGAVLGFTYGTVVWGGATARSSHAHRSI